MEAIWVKTKEGIGWDFPNEYDDSEKVKVLQFLEKEVAVCQTYSGEIVHVNTNYLKIINGEQL